jgi:hypothetical protein
MNFSTFGPFELKEWSKPGFQSLFDGADEERDGLANAMGVYLFATRGTNGHLVPWYVGKTIQGFRIRVPQHLEHLKTLSSKRSTKVVVFLIAQIGSSSKFLKTTAKIKSERGLRSIDILEFVLIGACLAKNRKLINARDAKFHKLFHVPGYWNSKPRNYDDAARQLANMLGTKFGI